MRGRVYISLLLLIVAVACEKSISYNAPKADSKLVLYSFIKPDSAITMQLSLTRPFDSSIERALEDVTGEIYLNGDNAGEVILDRESGKYYSPVYPKPGDIVKIVVRAKGVAEASGETILPLFPSTSIEVDTTLVGYNGKYSKIFFDVRIKNKGKGRDYFRLILENEQITEVDGKVFIHYINYNFDREGDPLLVGGSHSWFDGGDENIYNIFTNESFEGSEYMMKVSAETNGSLKICYEIGGEMIEQYEIQRHHLHIVQIDDATYQYLKSVMLAEREVGIIEPVQVYSNVSGGVGIVGYAYHTTVSFTMPFRRVDDIYSSD